MTEHSDRLRLFALNNLAIEAAIQRVEREHEIDLGHRPPLDDIIDETYYPQFEEKIRRQYSGDSIPNSHSPRNSRAPLAWVCYRPGSRISPIGH